MQNTTTNGAFIYYLIRNYTITKKKDCVTCNYKHIAWNIHGKGYLFQSQFLSINVIRLLTNVKFALTYQILMYMVSNNCYLQKKKKHYYQTVEYQMHHNFVNTIYGIALPIFIFYSINTTTLFKSTAVH